MRVSSFESLPAELLIRILGLLDSLRDVSAVTRTSKRLRLRVVDLLIDRHIEKRISEDPDPSICVLELFLHATNCDSSVIIERLTEKYRSVLDVVDGTLPLSELHGVRFTNFALCADAPRVAGHLLTIGSSYDKDNISGPAQYPDLTPLVLALARVRGNSQRELDMALGIACSYALPRTAHLLLTSGADPDAAAANGYTAVHMAVGRRDIPQQFERSLPFMGERLRWEKGRLELSPGVRLEGHEKWLELVRWAAVKRWMDDLPDKETRECPAAPLPSVPAGISEVLMKPEHSAGRSVFDPLPSARDVWNQKVTETVNLLVDFGARRLGPTAPAARAHTCSHLCWRSIDCDRGGQTAVGLAAASGLADAISTLVSRAGADPHAPDSGGFTPLYTAIAHGQTRAALLLLGWCSADEANPIVARSKNTGKANDGSTAATSALHAAARFAFPELLETLLSRGADPNTQDACGRTPLHEVLANDQLDRAVEVVECVQILRRAGADEHIRDGRGGGDGGGGGRSKRRATAAKTTTTTTTPHQMGRAHPLPAVRELFFPRKKTPNELTLAVMGNKRYDQLVWERLVRERQVSVWGDEYNADLARGGPELQAEFPALATAAAAPGGQSDAISTNSVGRGIRDGAAGARGGSTSAASRANAPQADKDHKKPGGGCWAGPLPYSVLRQTPDNRKHTEFPPLSSAVTGDKHGSSGSRAANKSRPAITSSSGTLPGGGAWGSVGRNKSGGRQKR